MDARIAARFYKLTAPASPADFQDLLLAEMGRSVVDRQKDLGGGVVLRVERCEERNGFIEGQFCRVQTVNVPPQADENGLTPIELGSGGLGHLAAFRYHPATRLLALQQNVQSATPHRVSLYVAGDNPAQLFTLEPVISQDAWERFLAKDARSFEVRFAGAEYLADADDNGVAVAHAAKIAAAAYNGLQVTVKVSVGRSRGRRLDADRLGSDILRIIGLGTAERITAKLDGEEQPLDLLHEHLRHVETLDLPVDPEGNYVTRNAFLQRAFVQCSPSLRRHGYGV